MTSIDPSIARALGVTASATPFKAVGVPGTAIIGGYIVEAERDPRLTGREKYRTYATMLANTSIVAAGVRYFLNLVSKAAWNVEPADDSKEAAKIAELVKDIIHDMTTPWHRVVRRAAMYRFYGFSLQEWTAKRRDDGVIGYLDIEPRPQKTIERWDTDQSGTVLGAVQTSPLTQKELYLPRGKLVYLVDDSLDDSPEGMGLFRHLVKRSVVLERFEILEQWGFERDLRGIPVGRAPLAAMAEKLNSGSLTADQIKQLREPIETFLRNALKGKDTALFLDSAVYRSAGEDQTPGTVPQWSIELLQGSSTSQPDMARAIERLNREMARVIGVEHLLLGSTSGGSYAMARDKSESFGLIVASTLQEVKEAFEADILTPLFELNGWDFKLFPDLKVEQVQYRDIEQVTTALKDMATAGAPLTPDDPAINEVRDLLGLSWAPEIDLDMVLQDRTGTKNKVTAGQGDPDELPEPEDKGQPVKKARKPRKGA